jgi:hypothetical protein
MPGVRERVIKPPVLFKNDYAVPGKTNTSSFHGRMQRAIGMEAKHLPIFEK